jgi:hypothetical protein
MSFFSHGKKQHNKTKEQIIAELEEKRKEGKRRTFIDEHFMPLMEEITTNLEDAQVFSQALQQTLQQSFNNLSKSMKVVDLHLDEKLNKNKPELTYRYEQVLNVLGDQTIDDAFRMLQGLFDEINRVINAEYGKKTLKELNQHGRTNNIQPPTAVLPDQKK